MADRNAEEIAAHEWLDQESAEVRGLVETLCRAAADAALGRPGGRLKTPEELEAMHGGDDRARREQILSDSFAEGRFVMFLERYDTGPGAISFSPRYDEAEQFLGWFLVPFVLGSQGIFRHNSWRAARYSTEYLRFSQIRSFSLLTETPEQRTALEKQLDEMVEAARLKADADRRAYSDYLRKVNRHLDDEHGGA